jgi:dihydroorotate dehydrogenase
MQKVEEAKKNATLGHKEAFFAVKGIEDYLDVAKTTYRYVGTIDLNCSC